MCLPGRSFRLDGRRKRDRDVRADGCDQPGIRIEQQQYSEDEEADEAEGAFHNSLNRFVEVSIGNMREG